MRSSIRLLALLALTACKPDPKAYRTAIQLALTTPDVEVPGDYLDTINIIVDPQSPFVDSEGEPIDAGSYSSRIQMLDYNTDDADLEMLITVDIAIGGEDLPVVELAEGVNEGPFTVTAYGYQGAYFTMQSADIPDLSFSNEAVVSVEVPLGLLDVFIGPCNDEQDNDEDGYIDDADPDCASGDEELGFGDTECNDGVDNDEDGSVDLADADCEGASDDDESTPCTNTEDDDGDGWVDDADPDCASGDEELGLGDTECNDGTDNDEDGDIDSGDAQCDSAEDNNEAPLPCEDLLDNDSDGWIDDADPDCASGADEIGFGDTECNDGIDNDTDKRIDSADPSCEAASDNTELNLCEDGEDNDGDGRIDINESG